MANNSRQKQRFDHGQKVFVYWRKALYPAEYRGYDNFQREESHRVHISASGGEEEVSANQIFEDYRRARRQFPNATDHVKGI